MVLIDSANQTIARNQGCCQPLDRGSARYEANGSYDETNAVTSG